MSWGPLPLTLIRSTCTTSTTSSFWWTSLTTSPTTCVTVSRVQVWWSDWFSRDCEPERQNCTASGFTCACVFQDLNVWFVNGTVILSSCCRRHWTKLSTFRFVVPEFRVWNTLTCWIMLLLFSLTLQEVNWSRPQTWWPLTKPTTPSTCPGRHPMVLLKGFWSLTPRLLEGPSKRSDITE